MDYWWTTGEPQADYCRPAARCCPLYATLALRLLAKLMAEEALKKRRANWYYVARWEKSGKWKIKVGDLPLLSIPSPVQPPLTLMFDI